jgi:hypothetical protein
MQVIEALPAHHIGAAPKAEASRTREAARVDGEAEVQQRGSRQEDVCMAEGISSLRQYLEETDETATMSNGSTIQFRQSKIGHDPSAHKLKTRNSLTPAPGSGLSSQPTSLQEEGVGLPGEQGIVSGRQSNVSLVYEILG